MSSKVVQTIAVFCISTIVFFIILEFFSSCLMPFSIAFSISILIGLLVAPAYYKDLFRTRRTQFQNPVMKVNVAPLHKIYNSILI
jgi:hypothetical protein